MRAILEFGFARSPACRLSVRPGDDALADALPVSRAIKRGTQVSRLLFFELEQKASITPLQTSLSHNTRHKGYLHCACWL